MPKEMPLPIAPNSRSEKNRSCGRDGICAKNHEQFDHIARVEESRLDVEHVAVGFRIVDTRGHGLGAPHLAARRQCRRQRLHAQPCIGAEMVARHFLALTQRAGIDVDMQHLRLWPELAAAAGVVGEGAADHDHQVGLFQIFEPDLGREAPRDADAVQVVVEESPCRQRRGQQSARFGGQRPARRPRLGFDRAQAGKHDHAFGGRNQLRGLCHVIRMRWHRREARQQFV
jgi:hypothetical protein